jgi:phosphoribosylamine--glycine ligase
MGSLSTASPTLPFMTPEHYRDACEIITRVIAALGDRGRRFNGVMNSGFFATAEGVKVIEFNARFGDPEAMNILTLLDGSWTHAMDRICSQELSAADVPLRSEASVVLYLVSPDYALGGGEPREFTLDRAAAEAAGCHVFFSSAVAIGDGRYRTVGTSRAVALATSAPSLARAHERVAAAAEAVPDLEWRHDVGDPRYLEDLTRLTRPAAPPVANAVGS